MRPTGEWLNQPGGLAERLTRIRKAAGLTGEQMAASLGWQRTKISKLENGRQMPTPADITDWARVTGLADEATAGLLAMLEDAQAVHRQWRHRLRGGHAALQAEFDALVRGASRIRNFEIMLIPGLLQTPDYARALLQESGRLHGLEPSGVEETVTARMRRQEVLYDSGRSFEFVITEAALGSFRPCAPEVMAGQLDRLASVPGLANVTLGIIPAHTQLALAPIVGFLMADDVTIVETYTDSGTLTGEESARHGEIMDALLAEAVTGDEARRLIVQAAR